jgi:NADPH:quinone reductase-like Zn-dependent oxidoreductase
MNVALLVSVACQVGDEVYGQTALTERGKDGSHAEYAVVYDTVRVVM